MRLVINHFLRYVFGTAFCEKAVCFKFYEGLSLLKIDF